MKEKLDLLPRLFAEIPAEERESARLTFAISDRIYDLMQERGLSKKTVCRCIGSPSE